MIDILNHHEKQLVLYTKRMLFEDSDLITDLKTIIGKTFDCNPERYSISDVLRYVERIYLKLVKANLIIDNNDRIFSELFHRAKLWNGKSHIEEIDVINFMYGQISIMPVRERIDNDTTQEYVTIIDLGEPDYTILPRGRA